MELKKIFADFNNADKHGRVRLDTFGSEKDIKENNIKLFEGKQVMLDDDEELSIIGILIFSKEENIWVAEIDWKNFSRR